MSDSYRIVTTRLRGVRPNSIFVDGPNGRGDVLIPRSLIHGADDAKLDGSVIGEEITFRLTEWKAEEAGWG